MNSFFAKMQKLFPEAPSSVNFINADRLDISRESSADLKDHKSCNNILSFNNIYFFAGSFKCCNTLIVIHPQGDPWIRF